MKKNLLLVALALLLAACTPSQKTVAPISIDDQWAFITGDDNAYASPDFDDSQWAKISFTKYYEPQGYPNYDGYAWYRKPVVIPESMKEAITANEGAMLSFRNVDDCDECFFNGTLIGSMGTLPPNYRTAVGQARNYKIPAELIKYGEPNLIAIRTYDGGGDGGMQTDEVLIRPLSAFDNMEVKFEILDPDYIFISPDPVKVNTTLINNNKNEQKVTIYTFLKTDIRPAATITQTVTTSNVKPGATLTAVEVLNFTPEKAGFYQLNIVVEVDGYTTDTTRINVGYNPEKMDVPTDSKPDFAEFWENSKKELAAIPGDYKMTLVPEQSNNDYNVYMVEMTSFGNERLTATYAQPKKPGKYPVAIEYMGYAGGGYYPSTTFDGFAHFVMSVRGQGFNKPTNKYGEWILYGLNSKDDYYYRGAFLDAVRAIDFVCSRPEIDAEKIVAQGGSQGGALTFAAVALDNRIKACAPTVPFLSDYRAYFKIVNWPGNLFEAYFKEKPDVNQDQVYDVLTYFDIKNLAPMIDCPMLMGIGVQDDICPPHINFAAYNQAKGEKRWIAYPTHTHAVGGDFNDLRLQFFKEKLGIQ